MRAAITASPARMPNSDTMGPAASSRTNVTTSDTPLDHRLAPANALNSPAALQEHRLRSAQRTHGHDERGDRHHGEHLALVIALLQDQMRKPHEEDAGQRDGQKPHCTAGGSKILNGSQSPGPVAGGQLARHGGPLEVGQRGEHQRGGPHQQRSHRQHREGLRPRHERDEIGMGIGRHLRQRTPISDQRVTSRQTDA